MSASSTIEVQPVSSLFDPRESEKKRFVDILILIEIIPGTFSQRFVCQHTLLNVTNLF